MRNYRGKRKDNGEWVYGSPVKLLDGDVIIVSKAAQTSIGHPHYPAVSLGQYSRVLPSTVGQQIGLKDKNGKEAYDGDEIQVLVDGRWCKDVIHWSNYGWFPWDCDDSYRGKEFEILGNIHENPDVKSS